MKFQAIASILLNHFAVATVSSGLVFAWFHTHDTSARELAYKSGFTTFLIVQLCGVYEVKKHLGDPEQ